MNNMHDRHHFNGETDFFYIIGLGPQLLLSLPFVIIFVWYIFAVIISNRRYRPWPKYRIVFWTLGVLAIVSVAGPLASHAHMNFTVHMIGHLLLGMLAPLLMALSRPMTLLLRMLSIPLARRLTSLLRKWPLMILTHPITAVILNIGGLWLIYSTELFSLMHHHVLLYLLIHIHVFMAGYLFTISILYIDPIPHRVSFLYRGIMLILALAGHAILSKYIFVHTPVGVPQNQAELGSLLMYYGGDVIDMAIIFIFCLQWFKSTQPLIRVEKVPETTFSKH
ncbi:cytochrome c oxidase assembly protein [Terrilactibacillus sp. BCM23-1]|uniref:Cytochrome c oxidase assembly protein n=1 Tax=Terrilactibacillus tamarindi TaxID=2599694 RepID=A0A6N8CSQ5_9BACI|nr:cytochrome c oxidase assembly protein [Terrilactibacillus tamarindi]MTT32730.1 cytochrome c oxidase assembly protein [Terrilactibacillus tamarindi]